MYADNSDNVASIRINQETIQLIAVVIGIFLLALLCLACSLHPGSVCSCCASQRRRNNRPSDDASHAYDTLNDFIFEQNSTTNNNDNNHNNNGDGDDPEMPTSLEQVFPDLLSEEGSGAWESDRRANRSSRNNNNNNSNNDLNEPLL